MLKSKTSANVGNPALIFAALGDKVRLELLSRLASGQTYSITQLTDGFHLSRQGVSKHLHVLEHAGIVQSNRVGRESHYSYVPEKLDEVKNYLEAVSQQWDDALNRLKLFVEE